MLTFQSLLATKFSASGREDVDVRMLGRGRPFVLEVVNPRNRDLSLNSLSSIEKDINSARLDVNVRDLQLASKRNVQMHIKEGESEKKKQYAAYCCCDRDLTSEDVMRLNEVGKHIVIEQKTPIRVLHR